MPTLQAGAGPVDNLYIDMNGILHPCFHPENGEAPASEQECFEAILAYIDALLYIVRPHTNPNPNPNPKPNPNPNPKPEPEPGAPPPPALSRGRWPGAARQDESAAWPPIQVSRRGGPEEACGAGAA